MAHKQSTVPSELKVGHVVKTEFGKGKIIKFKGNIAEVLIGNQERDTRKRRKRDTHIMNIHSLLHIKDSLQGNQGMNLSEWSENGKHIQEDMLPKIIHSTGHSTNERLGTNKDGTDGLDRIRKSNCCEVSIKNPGNWSYFNRESMKNYYYRYTDGKDGKNTPVNNPFFLK